MSPPRLVRREVVPRWELVERIVVDRVPADDFETELAPAVQSFVDEVAATQSEAPEPEQVLARIRHVLSNVPSAGDKADQVVVLEAKPRPPYFGVTTRLVSATDHQEKARR